MSPGQFIKKIKNFSTISFILPLVTMNVCLLIFKFVATIDIYPNLNLNNGIFEYSFIEVKPILYDVESYSLMSCSKYEVNVYYISNNNETFIDSDQEDKNLTSLINENKIKSIRIVPGKIIDVHCIKNYPFVFSLFDKFSFLEKLFIKTKIGNNSGFTQIKNPYLYGEVSISRTARYFPAVLIFKPFIILSAISLFFYWRNNVGLYGELKNRNILSKFSKRFYYFGLLSCIFLILHASFLGLHFESQIFTAVRKLIIILFIVFEVLAQILLTRNLFKFKKELENYINPFILKIKIIFVALVVFVTCVVFILLVWGNLDSSTKHILEWNYFSSLLIYYLLSRLLWRRPKTEVHTPEGA